MPVRRIQTKNEELNRVQDGIVPVLNALLTVPVLNSRLVETIPYNGTEIPIVLNTTFGNIPHRLGRRARGWIVIDQNADATVWRDTTPGANPDETKFLRLRASAAVTVKLLVF
jgi:hypothetical protein